METSWSCCIHLCRDTLRCVNLTGTSRFLAAVAMTVAIAATGCRSDDYEPPSTTTSPAKQTSSATAAAGIFASAADLCASSTAAGTTPVGNPDITEISGLAASRTQEIIWAHNDSGDTPRVFALSPAGEALATYEVRGAEAIDWEDMSLGPGPEPGVQYLYLGDIGDNASIRPEIVVYRAREPLYDPASSLQAVDAEALRLSYPDGAHDAETLFVDPVSGEIIIITKNIAGGPSGVYRASFPADATETTLQQIAKIDFAALTPAKEIPAGSGPLPSALGKIPTAGDISHDGSVIGVRTYGTIWLWQRNGDSIAAALDNPPCEAPSAIETQGESFAFTAIGYITASEGTPTDLHQFVLD